MDLATFRQLLDKYDDDALTDAEQQQLDHAIFNNKDLYNEFQFHKDVISGIRSKGRNLKRDHLDSLRDEVRNENINSADTKKGWMKWAFIGLITVGLIGLFIFLNQRTNNRTINNNKPAMVYSGTHMVKMLPDEGRLGGFVKKEFVLDIYINNTNSYQIQNDTILINIEKDLGRITTIYLKNDTLVINGISISK